MIRGIRHLLLRHARRAGDRRGIASIEFALIVPILILVLLALADIGRAVQQNIRLEAATRSALGYAHLYGTQTTTIRNIVLNALSGWNDVTVTVPALRCACLNTTSNVSTPLADCNTNCASPTEFQRFISITATRPYAGILFLKSRTLVGNAELRIQ